MAYMAHYNVSFKLNGETHYTSGDSTYPTKKDYIAGNYSNSTVHNNAMMFVYGYMDVMKLKGTVNPHTVAIQICFPE